MSMEKSLLDLINVGEKSDNSSISQPNISSLSSFPKTSIPTIPSIPSGALNSLPSSSSIPSLPSVNGISADAIQNATPQMQSSISNISATDLKNPSIISIIKALL